MFAGISGISAGIIEAGAARCVIFAGIPDAMAPTAVSADSEGAPAAS
jgi:hypothetical protein